MTNQEFLFKQTEKEWQEFIEHRKKHGRYHRYQEKKNTNFRWITDVSLVFFGIIGGVIGVFLEMFF